ncbi:MAG: type II secretion system F family protein [Candidatus Omnitrophota bacterium]
MAIFNYRAKKETGERIEGRIEAQSEKEAIERLSKQGYLPISLEEEKSGSQSTPTKESAPPITAAVKASRGRIKSRDLTLFTRSLASLLKAGVPILGALSVVLEQSESPRLKEILRNIYNEVKRGATFSSVLSRYPNVFSYLYVAMIHAGENSGDLPEALLRISEYRIKQEEMFSRIKMAMTYPVIMAVVGLGTIIFMLTFVMPRLMGIFLNMGQALPLPTQILILISDSLRKGWFWIALVSGIFILTVNRHSKTKAGKFYFSLLKLKLPIFGNFTLKAELARFTRTLELLVKNGISILKAIEIAIPVLGNEVIKEKLKKSYKELEEGSSFGKSLKQSKLIPLFVSNLITVGEESGKLEDVLQEISDSYEKDVDDAIKMMSNMLEPVMILVMGLAVGFIVIAMLLPVFEINV